MNPKIKKIFQSFAESEDWTALTTKKSQGVRQKLQAALKAFNKGKLTERRMVGILWDFGRIEIVEKTQTPCACGGVVAEHCEVCAECK